MLSKGKSEGIYPKKWKIKGTNCAQRIRPGLTGFEIQPSGTLVLDLTNKSSLFLFLG